MAKLKVLHLITRLDKGGSTDNTLYSALLADPEKFQVEVASGPSLDPPGIIQQNAEKAGIRFIPIPGLVREINPLLDLQCLFHLRSLFRMGKYDIVHTHTSKAGIVGRWAAWVARVPVIIHTPHGHIFYGYYGPFITKIFMFLEWITGWITTGMVAISAAEKADYVRYRIMPEEKISLIPSGVEVSVFYQPAVPAPVPGLTDGDFIIGTVARLELIKNHKTLIAVAGLLQFQIQNLKWLFIGDGELKTDLVGQVRHSGLENNVLFLGWREDIPHLLSRLQVFVLASYNEGMGRAIVEAQASGLPVVASEVCGIRDLVRNGENGFLVPPDKPGLFAERILKLYNDRELRKTMGKKAREGLAPEYQVRHMVDSLEKLYNRFSR
jgi:glycosyltransferase involved in cell wall biosynthesis